MTLLSGVLGGVLSVLFDLLLLARQGHTPDVATALHAICAGVMAGGILGTGVWLLVNAGRLLGRGVGRPALAGLPLGLAAFAAFLWLNGTLFDGPWIRQQAWVEAARIGFFAAGALGILLALVLGARVLRAGRRLRWTLAVAALLAAVAADHLCLTAFGAYPRLKLELAAIVWIASASACALLLAGISIRPRVAAPLILLLVAGSLGVVLGQRATPDIHRIRTAITGLPLPAASKALRPLERVFLERLVSLPEFLPSAPRGVGGLRPTWDEDLLRRRLDEVLPSRRDMNVVWIAVDALRADHVHALGYERPITPSIDRLAATSALFTRAVTPVPASAMGYSASLTGLFARVTPAYAAEFGVSFPVPDDFSLPAVLAARGWRTTAYTAFFDSVCNRPNFRTHRQGFQEFNPGKPARELSAVEVTDGALEVLRRHGEEGEPFFLWVHYMDPHAPYFFHEEFPLGDRPIDAYDAEIAFADREIGRLLSGLEKLGLDERTIIVLFGDHGEGFGEHNNREHGSSLHDHQVRVPLVIRIPGLQPKRIDHWVGLQDLTPTVISLLGTGDPYRRLGRDLSPLLLGIPCEWPDVTYAERAASASKRPRSWERAVWSGDLKLIWKPHEDTLAVYDLARDPGETHNILDPGDAEHARLLGDLRAYDREIDGYWNESSAGGDEPGSPGNRVATLEEALKTAADEARGLEIVGSIKGFLESLGEQRLARPEPVLAKALESLSTVLMEKAEALDSGSRLRGRILLLLTQIRDPRIPAFLAREGPRTSSLMVRLSLAIHRAEEGDRSVEGLLRRICETGPLGARFGAASGLAMLGHAEVRPLLHLALQQKSPSVVAPAVKGLAVLKDTSALERALFSHERLWRRGNVASGLLETCRRLDSALAVQGLMLLSSSLDPVLSEAATAELRSRLEPEEVSRALDLREAVAGARDALLYHRPDLIVRYLAGCGEKDARLLGVWWWLLGRAAWEAGDVERARFSLSMLSRAFPGDARMERLVRNVSPHLDQPPARGLDEHEIRATFAGELAPKKPRSNAFFYVAIRFENAGTKWLPGGEWPDTPAFSWRFLEEGRPQENSRAPMVRLPLEGLAPGETVELQVLGRFPARKGRYVAELVMSRPGSGDVRVLARTGEVILER